MDDFLFDDVLITPIIEILDSGLEKLLPSLLILASLFAVLDSLWGYFQYSTSKDLSSIIPKLIGKWIRYAFTFGLFKIYVSTILPMAYNIFTEIGNSFGEGFGNPLKIQKVWDIGWVGVQKLLHIAMEMKSLWSLVYVIFFIIAFLCLITIISVLTMSILTFNVVVRLAVIFLAFVPLEAFADIGRKTLTSIINAGTDLMVCVAMSSMCFAVITKHPIPEEVSFQNNAPQLIGIWLCIWLVSAFLVLFHKNISSMIISGSGGLTGSDFGRYIAGGAATTGAVVAGGTALLTNASGGFTKKVGESVSKNVNSKTAKKVGEGIKKGGELTQKGGNLVSKGISKTASGASATIKAMTGDFQPVETTLNKIQNYSPNSKQEKEEETKNDDIKESTNSSSNNTENKNSTQNSKNETSKETDTGETINKTRDDNKENITVEKTGQTNQSGSSVNANKTATTGNVNKDLRGSSNARKEENTLSNNSSTSSNMSKGNNLESNSQEKGTSFSNNDNNISNDSGTSATSNKSAEIQSTEKTLNTDSYSNNSTNYSSDENNIETFSNEESSSGESFVNAEKEREKNVEDLL